MDFLAKILREIQAEGERQQQLQIEQNQRRLARAAPPQPEPEPTPSPTAVPDIETAVENRKQRGRGWDRTRVRDALILVAALGPPPGLDLD